VQEQGKVSFIRKVKPVGKVGFWVCLQNPSAEAEAYMFFEFFVVVF
jgi:hypothetical protein